MKTKTRVSVRLRTMTHAEFLRLHRTQGVLFFAQLAKPQTPRTRSADRTRSRRWRAGTKRARKQIAAALKLGLPHPFRKGWPAGWIQMGATNDPDEPDTTTL